MRITVEVDEAILDRAHELSGLKNRRILLEEALRLFNSRSAGRRLADKGGSQPDLRATPRRRAKRSKS